MNEILEQVQRDIKNSFDEEIRKTIMGATVTSDFENKTDHNPIEDLNNMIAKMSTVIMCSENDKKKLEEQELPGMTTVIPNQYLEDGTVYMITDEKLKRDMLEADRIRRLKEKEFNKRNNRPCIGRK